MATTGGVQPAYGGQNVSLASAIAPANFNTDPADRGGLQGPATVLIDTTAGSTPTVTANLQASMDNVNWFNVEYALVGTPTTKVITAITITTTTITTYLITGSYGWRFFRVAFSANTNVTVNNVVFQAH